MKRTHAEAEFARLLIDLDELHLHFIAFLQAAGLHVFEAVPADFADVEQSVASGHKFNECAKFEYAANLAGVNLVNLWNSGDDFDAGNSSVNLVFFWCADVDFTFAVDFVNSDSGAGFFLYGLNHFTALADDSANEFLIDGHVYDARNVRLIVFAWCGNCFVDELENVQASLFGLAESLLKNFVGQTVALDIHLGGSDAVGGTGHLEVHVAQVVFVAEDVAEHGVLHVALIGDKSHGDACHRLLHLHASVEQCHAACAHGGH